MSCNRHDNHGHPDAFHTFGNTADNDRRRTGDRLIGQILRRLEFVTGRVFGPFSDDPAGDQADDHANRHGPELRQYVVAGNNEERPFTRDERSWVYASSKQQNNY